MLKINKETFLLYVRNFIFGAEDSLVSTVGLLAGISVGGAARANIIMTGVVLIFVEAFSMAVGSFLSEQSTEEYAKRGRVPFYHALPGGGIMFISYFVAGLVPLLPYLIIESEIAFTVSIGLTLISLFILGFISAEVLQTKIWRNAWRMLIIGGLAVGIGVVVGRILNL